MYDWVLNTPLERFIQNALQMELPLLPLKSVLLGKIITYKLAVSSTTESSRFSDRRHEYATPRK